MGLIGAALALALLLGGCGVDRDFDGAVKANTIGAYDEYLRLHPDGAHAADARARLAALVEEREWQRARSLATIDGYQQYLRGYPQGTHSKEALVAIADLNLASLPTTEAGAPAAPPSAAAPPASAPTAKPARTARREKAPPTAIATPLGAAPAPAPAPAPGGGTRIQLGAFGSQVSANAAWQRLVARHGELAGRSPVLENATTADGRRLVRLQVAGFDKAGAQAACAGIAKTGDACLVVPASR